MTEELRKLSGFYDNNDHFTDTVTTAQEIPDEQVGKHTWIYDHLNSCIIGLNVVGLNAEKLWSVIAKDCSIQEVKLYKPQMKFISPQELMENKGRHWAPIPVNLMSVKNLARQISQYIKNTNVHYFS